VQPLLDALADPVRFEIVGLLAERERTVGELVARFPISGPAISRHLRVLRESGIATYRQDAQRRLYALNPQSVEAIQGWAQQLLQQWHTHFDALGRHLDAVALTGETT
jgi:DNA-binding transcriptional ArsR family regulator